ncbi:hypothetical protein IJJ37_02545 [Candidatus Saccharibacteria bacterium]|nr:hypothetical protein [Candidatus Saccharibacteria bacterium]
MNKDVIYIEPEDDITDIITKINNSKDRIVALVPPKKAAVLRSIVNIKLIAKAGAGAGKSVVIVTTEPAIIKLAATAKLPVTKNLQSAPVIPTAEEAVEEEITRETLVKNADKIESEEIEETVEVAEVATEPAKKNDSEKMEEAKKEAEEIDDDKDKEGAEDDSKVTEKKVKKAKDGTKSSNPVIAWIQEHKKIVIGCGMGLVALILVMVWAFGIAPAATVTVDLRTTTSNFSENATFTTTLADENASEGKFYLTEKKLEDKAEVEFEATGEKNVGQKASGEVVIYAYFRKEGDIAVNSGSIFSYDGLNYISQKDITLAMTGSTVCENTNPAELALSGCLISARVPVVAENPGTKYNVGAADRGWSTSANVSAYTDKAMSGGTDETVTVVQQSDIDKAKETLAANDKTANKEKLLEGIPEGSLVIEGSFKQTVGDAVSSPAVGEQVEDGKKAKLTVVTTSTIFYVDRTKIEEFIREKAKLADNFKIYSMNDPFVENFVKTESGYTGKIKTAYVSGPEVTENSVIEVVKGKGVGTAQHDLSEINGIGKIKIDTSFPWVSSIPNDPEKITVIINVEE